MNRRDLLKAFLLAPAALLFRPHWASPAQPKPKPPAKPDWEFAHTWILQTDPETLNLVLSCTRLFPARGVCNVWNNHGKIVTTSQMRANLNIPLDLASELPSGDWLEMCPLLTHRCDRVIELEQTWTFYGKLSPSVYSLASF